jgi:hypothetical protein
LLPNDRAVLELIYPTAEAASRAVPWYLRLRYVDTFVGLLPLFVQLSVKLPRHVVLLARKEFTVVTLSTTNAAVLKHRACQLRSITLYPQTYFCVVTAVPKTGVYQISSSHRRYKTRYSFVVIFNI